MPEMRDWSGSRALWIRLLEQRTGEHVDVWNRRVRKASIRTEDALRTWLEQRGVTGYAQSLLVMERFGYPPYLTAGASELLDAQYADRQHLRAVYDAIVAAAEGVGDVIVQVRKSYVSLLAPQRTFARVQSTTRTRVHLALRLNAGQAHGRLVPSRLFEHMAFHIVLTSTVHVDDEVVHWLRVAYEDNC